MATIKFEDARLMTTDADDWMKTVSNYIASPDNPKPQDLYATQKLAFELDKADLEALTKDERVIGILGFEKDANSLTVILVSVDSNGKPSELVKPRQTWPLLNTMDELHDVLNTYLTP